MYKVVQYFEDLQDNGFAYNVGDVFPRENHTVTDERIQELASTKNRRCTPLIAFVPVIPELNVSKPKKSKATNKK